jgi:hypothetical protein
MTKGMAQSDLAEAADPRHIYKLEHAKSDATLRMVEDIGKTTGFDPLTLLALSISADRSESLAIVLERLQQELSDFEAAGGLVNLATLVELGPVDARRHARAQKQAEIQECKAAGLTQRQTAEKLKIAKSTVAGLWNI